MYVWETCESEVTAEFAPWTIYSVQGGRIRLSGIESLCTDVLVTDES
jgi:hypothetical protein